MGAVCSAGMVEKNGELGGKSLGFSGKLKKENSFVNRREAFSDSRSNSGHDRKKKKHDTGFSRELGLSIPSPGGKQVCFHSACIVCMFFIWMVENVYNMHIFKIISVIPELDVEGNYIDACNV